MQIYVYTTTFRVFFGQSNDIIQNSNDFIYSSLNVEKQSRHSKLLKSWLTILHMIWAFDVISSAHHSWFWPCGWPARSKQKRSAFFDPRVVNKRLSIWCFFFSFSPQFNYTYCSPHDVIWLKKYYKPPSNKEFLRCVSSTECNITTSIFSGISISMQIIPYYYNVHILKGKNLVLTYFISQKIRETRAGLSVDHKSLICFIHVV